MRTWQELRECDIRDELLDDQYGLIGHRDTAGTDMPNALVLSLGFAEELARKYPDIRSILDEEKAALQVYQPVKHKRNECRLNGRLNRGKK